MKDMISIKPHHVVDIITALGEGKTEFKPHERGHALHIVAEEILDNPDVNLKIELGADDLCKPCRHNVNGVCNDTIDTSYRPLAPKSKNEWNLLIDRRWCGQLEIRPGDTFTGRELGERIKGVMGDISAIYREIPTDRTKRRQRDLIEGIRKYLGE